MLVTGGSTDGTTYFQMRLTAGGDATGLTVTDFDLTYTRSGDTPAAKVDATALAAANSAHADNKMIEVDATDCPGLYRVDWPDAAFAAGAREVILTVKHASCFTESLRVEIDGEVSVTEWNGVKLGTTNPLPNAAADAAGGLPTTTKITDARLGVLTDWINGGRLDLLLDAIPTTPMRGTDGANTVVPDAAGVAPTAAEIKTAIEAGGSSLAQILTLATAIDTLSKAAGDGDLAAIKVATDRLTAVRAAVLTDWIDGGRLDLLLDAVNGDLPVKITKNTAYTNFMFKMVDATDGYTAETGLTVTATRSLGGAAFGACANAASEVASGWYKIDLDAADTNGDPIILRFTATGARDTEFIIIPQKTT
jgi:hypothetical protein